MVDPVPDYCPFCGARLHDDGFEAHLDRHDDCAERYSAWRADERAGPTGEGGFSGDDTVGVAVLLGIVAVVLAYSHLVAQRLLLGIVASAIVVAAFLAAKQ
jgi:hypothetical protein